MLDGNDVNRLNEPETWSQRAVDGMLSWPCWFTWVMCERWILRGALNNPHTDVADTARSANCHAFCPRRLGADIAKTTPKVCSLD
jgi:hypothetical protein